MISLDLKGKIYDYVLKEAPKYLHDKYVYKVNFKNFKLTYLVNRSHNIITNLNPLISFGEKELEVYIKHNYFKLTNSEIKVVVAYLFNDITEAYTVKSFDLTGRTIIRAGGNTDYSITIPVLTGLDNINFVGKTLNIRSNTDNYITVNKNSGVTINSLDALILRRNSSTISLVYLGNQVWDVYGELP